jgi:hypothetical protein
MRGVLLELMMLLAACGTLAACGAPGPAPLYSPLNRQAPLYQPLVLDSPIQPPTLTPGLTKTPTRTPTAPPQSTATVEVIMRYYNYIGGRAAWAGQPITISIIYASPTATPTNTPGPTPTRTPTPAGLPTNTPGPTPTNTPTFTPTPTRWVYRTNTDPFSGTFMQGIYPAYRSVDTIIIEPRSQSTRVFAGLPALDAYGLALDATMIARTPTGTPTPWSIRGVAPTGTPSAVIRMYRPITTTGFYTTWITYPTLASGLFTQTFSTELRARTGDWGEIRAFGPGVTYIAPVRLYYVYVTFVMN